MVYTLPLISLNVLLVKKHGNIGTETIALDAVTTSPSANTVPLEIMISNAPNALEINLLNSYHLICLMDLQLHVDVMLQNLCLLIQLLYLIQIVSSVHPALGELTIALYALIKDIIALSVKKDTLKIKMENAQKTPVDQEIYTEDVQNATLKLTLASFTKHKMTHVFKNVEIIMSKLQTTNVNSIVMMAGIKIFINASNVMFKIVSTVIMMENVLNVRMIKYAS